MEYWEYWNCPYRLDGDYRSYYDTEKLKANKLRQAQTQTKGSSSIIDVNAKAMKAAKLRELGSMIRGTSLTPTPTPTKTKGASMTVTKSKPTLKLRRVIPLYQSKTGKLRELGQMIKGF